jgi:hypothetical protein
MPKNLCAPEVGGKAMPRIERYRFGHVVVDGEEQTRDVVVLPDRVLASWWRAEGHKLVLADLDDVIEELPERLVVGTGAFRRMRPERETLAELRRQLDDDRLWAADLAEPIDVFVALHLANEFPSVGSQASDDGVDVVDCECEMAEARGVRRRVPVAPGPGGRETSPARAVRGHPGSPSSRTPPGRPRAPLCGPPNRVGCTYLIFLQMGRILHATELVHATAW